jgi:hypothetical protein
VPRVLEHHEPVDTPVVVDDDVDGEQGRLPPSLAAAAVDLSLPAGLLVTHHTDISGNAPSLMSAFTTEVATLVARFGPAGWPGLQIAGISLYKTGSRDWLAVLEAHGPAAVGGVAQGPLPEELCERILDTPNRYPREWISSPNTAGHSGL